MRPARHYDVLGVLITPFELLGLATLALVCAIAVWRGGQTEKRIATVIAIAWVGSVIVDDDASAGAQWGIFAIDVVLAVWLIAETLFSGRRWPAFAGAAQTLIVMTHLGFMVDANIVKDAFFSAYYLWSYVVLACLGAGSLLNPPAPQNPTEG